MAPASLKNLTPPPAGPSSAKHTAPGEGLGVGGTSRPISVPCGEEGK